MQEWIWQHMRFDLPDHWEMLQFSRCRELGSCAFADRYEFRFELNWKQLAGPPDFSRLLADYTSALKSEHGYTGVQELRRGEWQGFGARIDDRFNFRFGRWLASRKCLVELVFFGPEPFEHGEVPSILDSFDVVPVASCQRWRAFGLNLRADSELPIDACVVLPGLAQMTFADRGQAEHFESFERRGMTSVWLTGPVHDWLRGKAPENLRDARESSEQRQGHEVLFLTGQVPSLRFPRIVRSPYEYRAAAWICPEDRRLYSVSEIQPLNRTSLPTHEKLCCCERLACG